MPAPKLFDAHTHIQFSAFEEDQDAVIQRTLEEGIWMINVGTLKRTSMGAIEVARRYNEGVYATVGLHPIHTEQSYHDPQELGTSPQSESGEGDGFKSHEDEFDYDYYKNLASDPKVVAIGECGFDYYRIKDQGSRIKQQEAFVRQIELAHEVKKPLMIHCREAYQDLINILDSRSKILNSPSGVIHFFSGTINDARKLLNMGFSFSFGGVITFARTYDEVINFIPISRILLETDAPYVSPSSFRGKRNSKRSVFSVRWPFFMCRMSCRVLNTQTLNGSCFQDFSRNSSPRAESPTRIQFTARVAKAGQ